MESILAKAAKASSNEQSGKNCLMPAERTEIVQLISDREIDASIVGKSILMVS